MIPLRQHSFVSAVAIFTFDALLCFLLVAPSNMPAAFEMELVPMRRCFVDEIKRAAGARGAGFLIMQSDIPFIISNPGKYTVGQHLIWQGASAAITINASSVNLDLNGQSIDLQFQGSNGIIVQHAHSVEIRNGSIVNTKKPNIVYLPAGSPFTHVKCTLDNAATISGALMTFMVTATLRTPFDVANPLSSLGIGLQGTRDVIIENMHFDDCYIGIGAPGVSQETYINNCQFYECGYDAGITFSPVEFRGGAIVFWTDIGTTSSHIDINNCIGHSSIANNGIKIENMRYVTCKNSVMELKQPGDNGVAENDSVGFYLGFCSDFYVGNCVGTGGSKGFEFVGVSFGRVEDCTSQGCENASFISDYTDHVLFQNCGAEHGINNPAVVNHASTGFVSQVSFNNIWHQCTALGLNSTATTGPGAGAGFDLRCNSRSTIKHCLAVDCTVGFTISGCQNLQIVNDHANNCVIAGFVQAAGLTSGLVSTTNPSFVNNIGNQWMSNEATNNGTNYMWDNPAWPIPNIVDAALGKPGVGRLENISQGQGTPWTR